MDLSASVERAEKSLRMVVRELMPDWQSRPGAPGGTVLSDRRDNEQRKRVGANVSNDLLDFINLGELVEVIQNNSQTFERVFPDSDRIRTLLTSLNDYRNPINHYRDLIPAEQEYLSGTCGLITNLVTKYKSDPSDLDRYFARIISVKDQQGSELGVGRVDEYGNEQSAPTAHAEVGDTLTFDCVGTDARDRELLWRFYVGISPMNFSEVRARAKGNPARLVWEVTGEDYGRSNYCFVDLSTPSDFRRHHSPAVANAENAGYDDRRSWPVMVLPPWDER